MNIKKAYISGILLGIAMTGLLGCAHTDEFEAQAKLGQPIVRAIEDYLKQTGTYPGSLDELPLKTSGWTYMTFVDDTQVTYELRYSMGQGDVVYIPSSWLVQDKGHTILLNVE